LLGSKLFVSKQGGYSEKAFMADDFMSSRFGDADEDEEVDEEHEEKDEL
jgi:hypothetical protein